MSGVIIHLHRPSRTLRPALPNGMDPTAVTEPDIVEMIDDIRYLAYRLRSRKNPSDDDIKAAAWLMFMAAVFTERL
jgi:hypothetical protein